MADPITIRHLSVVFVTGQTCLELAGGIGTIYKERPREGAFPGRLSCFN